MKKLLTVLLAMAIVCTYSIPAVFAAAPTATSDVATAEAAMSTAIDTAYAYNFVYTSSGTIYSVDHGTTQSYTNDADADVALDSNLTKAAIDATIAQIKADINTQIAAAYSANASADLTAVWTGILGTTDSTGATYAPNLASIVFGADATNTTNGNRWFGSYGAADGILYTTAVTNEKATATAYLNTIDPSLYVEASTLKTAKTALSNAITNATNDSGATTATGLADLIAALGTFKTAVGNSTLLTSAATAFDSYKTAAKKAVTDAGSALMAAETDRLQKVIAGTAAGFTGATAAQKVDAQAKLSSLATNVTALDKIYTDQIDAIALSDYDSVAEAKADVDTIQHKAITAAGTSTGVFDTDTASAADGILVSKYTNFYAAVTNLSNKDALIKYAQGYATGLEDQYSTDTGLATYNKATVEKYLAKVVTKINNLDVKDIAGVIAEFAACPTAAGEKATLTAFKADAKLVITNTYASSSAAAAAMTSADKADLAKLYGTYLKTAWDTDYQDAIADIQDAYSTKIDAATSEADVIALAKEAQAKMDAVALRSADANNVKDAVLRNAKSLNYATLATGIGGTLKAYADSKNTSGQYSAAIVNDAVQQAYNVLRDAVLAQKNTNMTDTQIQQIMKDNYAAALAKIDAMKTSADLATAANAVIAAIKALPTTATLDTKAQYLAVEKQYEDYLALAGAKYTDITNQPLLDGYMTKIISLEKSAVESQIAALPSTITVDNQAAVEAARTAYTAYKKAYSGYADTTADAGLKYSYTDINSAYQTKLGNAETALSTAKTTNAAKLIAALPTLPTLADADAVKAAQAAYDNLSDSEKAAFSSALVAKLAAAQKALSAEMIAATQSLKLTAKSAAVKGKMTITWKVNGTAVTGVKYQVMRSLHKNYGYKLMKTTSLKKYVNTKNLKAGKVYYYKVRAFITVDGVKYYSDWSNKAFRTAK